MINIADLLMVIHFLWALFMVLGLPLGLWLGSPALRWAHFVGMFLTAFFAATGMYCPLTVWEEILRIKTDPEFTYGGSLLARLISNTLYPQMDPWIIRAASVLWGLLTLLMMVIKKPGTPISGREKTKSG